MPTQPTKCGSSDAGLGSLACTYRPMVLGCQIVTGTPRTGSPSRLSTLHPGVQLDVKLTNPGGHQVQELRERKIDLLITRATGQQDDFHSEVLFDEPFVFIVGPAKIHAESAAQNHSRLMAIGDR